MAGKLKVRSVEQNNKKAHSPITINTEEDDPRWPVKDRLGLMQDYVQDETPKRLVKDRLGTRRSKRNVRPVRPFDPFKLGYTPHKQPTPKNTNKQKKKTQKKKKIKKKNLNPMKNTIKKFQLSVL